MVRALCMTALTSDAAMQAASADYSHCHQAQRLMPADPHHSGAAIILYDTVGEAAGQERRPSAAATVGTCYGQVPKTMTLDPQHLTPAGANLPPVSVLRSPTTRIGHTSVTPEAPFHSLLQCSCKMFFQV